MNRPPGVPPSDRPTIELGHALPTTHSLTHFRLGGMLAILGNFAMAVSTGPQTEPDNAQNTTESDDDAVPQPEASNTARAEKGREAEPNVPRSALGVPLAIYPTIQEDDHQSEASLEQDAKQMLNTRLCIAFSLFLVFWMVRKVLFCATW
jgi:hypothetical protein